MAVPKYDEESQNFSLFFILVFSAAPSLQGLSPYLCPSPPLSPKYTSQGFQFVEQSQVKALHTFLNPIQCYLFYKVHIITLLSPTKLSGHWDNSPAQPHHTGN